MEGPALKFLSGHYVAASWSEHFLKFARRHSFQGWETYRMLSASLGDTRIPGPPVEIEVIAGPRSYLLVIDGEPTSVDVEAGISEVPLEKTEQLLREIMEVERLYREEGKISGRPEEQVSFPKKGRDVLLRVT